jgi:hypothetical protein
MKTKDYDKKLKILYNIIVKIARDEDLYVFEVLNNLDVINNQMRGEKIK